MSEKKEVYKNTKQGTPLLSVISSGCKTPLLKVKFSTLVKPFYYPNSPSIPRYSVTCLVDPAENKEFLKAVQTIEKNEGVETIIKHDTYKEDEEVIQSGKYLIKFQTKEKIPVYLKKDIHNKELSKADTQLDLEDELEKDEKVVVTYDILRYTKKYTAKVEHGLSFRATAIFLYKED